MNNPKVYILLGMKDPDPYISRITENLRIVEEDNYQDFKKMADGIARVVASFKNRDREPFSKGNKCDVEYRVTHKTSNGEIGKVIVTGNIMYIEEPSSIVTCHTHNWYYGDPESLEEATELLK